MRIIPAMIAFLSALAFSAPTVALADNSADMNFKGILADAPPCKINDGNRVEVDFGGKLGVNKIDGTNYRQKVNYQVTCEAGSHGSAVLKLSLAGIPTGFDTAALETDMNALGIRIYQNNQVFPPGSDIDIDASNPPLLEAVPVQKAGATLSEGNFEAWATLRAEYQ